MARIAVLLDDMFEDSEYQKPAEAFRQAGHQLTVIGQQSGKEVKGYHGTMTARVEKSIDEVRPDEFDALFIPGGYSPDHLRANPKIAQFTQQLVRSGKPTFAICHGPQLLMTADVVRGRRMTAWKTIQDDLRKVGADVVDQEVAVDGNLVTSRQPGDFPAFVGEAEKLLSARPATV
jgi:protease I